MNEQSYSVPIKVCIFCSLYPCSCVKEVKTDTVTVVLYQTARQIHNSRQKQGHKQEVASGEWQPVQSRKIQEYKKQKKIKTTHGDNTVWQLTGTRHWTKCFATDHKEYTYNHRGKPGNRCEQSCYNRKCNQLEDEGRGGTWFKMNTYGYVHKKTKLLGSVLWYTLLETLSSLIRLRYIL